MTNYRYAKETSGLPFFQNLVHQAENGNPPSDTIPYWRQIELMAIIAATMSEQTMAMLKSSKHHRCVLTEDMIWDLPQPARDAHRRLSEQKDNLCAEQEATTATYTIEREQLVRSDLLDTDVKCLLVAQRAVLNAFTDMDIAHQICGTYELQLKNADLSMRAYDVAFGVEKLFQEVYWHLQLLVAKHPWLESDLDNLIDYHCLKLYFDDRFADPETSYAFRYKCSICEQDLYTYYPPDWLRDEFEAKKSARAAGGKLEMGPSICRAVNPLICSDCHIGFHAECLVTTLTPSQGGLCPDCKKWKSKEVCQAILDDHIPAQRFINIFDKIDSTYKLVGSEEHIRGDRARAL
ncbi:hypothetical protein B0A52_02975 [Exophiala mesophila]|uniref:Uncharacterized protein n=1 Tax=Exophiala mesophila TaxID=212818 RepID=A0A438NCD8_EXOME|nr:hypothetical protein B0A52_02975 [Exophiala mesophila]